MFDVQAVAAPDQANHERNLTAPARRVHAYDV
jgi:hypothetical protein